MQQRQREEHREAEHGCDAHRGLDCPGEWPVDLVLSCVDNYAARITISQACNEAGELNHEITAVQPLSYLHTHTHTALRLRPSMALSNRSSLAALRFVEPSMVWSTAAVLSAGMEMRPQKLDSCGYLRVLLAYT